MINYYFKNKMKKIISIPPKINDIRTSKKILFSIFSRYGDTIISLVVVREFIEKYPEKEYLILCPRQMKPYVNEFLPNIECVAFNKRNLFEILKVKNLLKKRMFDIGFNPWSNGLESSYFISFCNKFMFYKEFIKPSIINHYQVVRNYLQLPKKDWMINDLIMKESYQRILICPQSTDKDRSLTNQELDTLITNFNAEYNEPHITIATMDKSFHRVGCNKFFFNKANYSSAQFLSLVKKNSLVVCTDSGPLHIALALNKDLLALFRATIPEIVLNSGSYLKVRKLNY